MSVDNVIILKNNIKFSAVRQDRSDTVSLVIFIKGGIFRENADNNGIGALFGRTWLKSNEFMEHMEFYGGAVSCGVAHDYFEFSLSIPTDFLDMILPQLEKLLVEPQFNDDIFSREKEIALEELEAEKDNPNRLSFQYFLEATYGSYPYSLKTEGSVEILKNLSLIDIKNYYEKHFSSGDMSAVLCGRFSENQKIGILKIAEKIKNGISVEVNCSGSSVAEDSKTEKTDSRIKQSKLFVSYTAPGAADSRYIPLKVLNEILGGGMSSPYFDILRKVKGYAYSVGSIYPSRLCSSRLIGHIGLQYENVDDAVKTMMEINKGIFQTLTPEELAKAKNHMLGEFLSDIETNRRKAWYSAFFGNLGLGFDYAEQYLERLRSVSLEDINKLKNIFDGHCTVFIYKPE